MPINATADCYDDPSLPEASRFQSSIETTWIVLYDRKRHQQRITGRMRQASLAPRTLAWKPKIGSSQVVVLD